MKGGRFFLLGLVALGLAGFPRADGEGIDLDKPEPDRMFLDLPWGGLPIVSSEVGAEPQAMGDPETMNPVYGTCQMPGIIPRACTPDCAFECSTPECSLGCFCGCHNEGKAMYAQMLAEQRQRTQVLAARDVVPDGSHEDEADLVKATEPSTSSPAAVLGGDAQFWKKALLDMKQDDREVKRNEIKQPFKVAQEKRHKANPRYQAYQRLVEQQRKEREARPHNPTMLNRHMRRVSTTRDPFAETDGFSWEKFHPVDPYRTRGRPKGDQSPYALETADMDNVFDPSLDWDNTGEHPFETEGTNWWGAGRKDAALAEQENWWSHVPQGFAAGKKNPFGTKANAHALGWF